MSQIMGGGGTGLDTAVSPVIRIKVKDAALRRAMERERVRADRSGRDLSLVFFRVKGLSPMTRPSRRVLDVLTQRARITDEVGILGRRRAYALLPDTSEAGATRFAAAICQRLGELRTPVTFKTHTYRPTGSDDNSNGGGDRRGLDDVRASDRIVVVRDPQATASASRAGEPDSWDVEVAAKPQACAVAGGLFERPTPLWKRLIDIAGAGTVLLAASPVMLIIAAAIKLDSPGPVIFKQKRAGLGGRPFTMLKFRTMCNDAEALKRELLNLNEVDGPAFKLKDDPRITRLGYFLRRMSLDELPQLFNVLRGDMTLVGPRPLPCHESEGCAHWHRARLHVKPGLTCTWQISGRSQIAFNDWMRMDLAYVRSRSVWTDVRILAGTVPAVVLRRGAY